MNQNGLKIDKLCRAGNIENKSISNPRISVIWITSDNIDDNKITENLLNTQTIIDDLDIIVFANSGNPYFDSELISRYKTTFNGTLITYCDELSNVEKYNAAKEYLDDSLYVTAIKSGDEIGPDYYEVCLNSINGSGTGTISKEYLLISSEKKYKDSGWDVLSRRSSKAKVQTIDFNSQYGSMPVFLEGTFVKTDYFLEHSFRTDLNYDNEKEYFLKLASVCMEMLIIKCTYTCSRVSEAHQRLFSGAYDRYWYIDSFDKFWIPFMDDLKVEKGLVPIVFQYMLFYAIRLRMEANLNNRNKHCIQEDEAYEYLNSWKNILKYIDDTILMNSYEQEYCKINPFFKRMLLRIKYQDEKLEFDPYYFKRTMYFGKNDILESKMSDQSVDIQYMECRDGKIHIDALLSDLYDLNNGQFSVDIDNELLEIKYNNRYSHIKLFGVSVYKRISFEINVPIQYLEKQRISFRYTNEFGSMLIPLTFGSHFSKLSKKYGRNYWSFYVTDTWYTAQYNNNSILITKVGRNALKKKEYKLRISMLKDKKNRKKAWKFLALRTAYFTFKPLMKKRSIWLFMDKIYKGGDSSEYLYKYAVKQDDNVDKYYLIDKNVPDYQRLLREGYKPLIRGSLKHRLIFLYSDLVIASNSTVCEFNDYNNENSSYVRDLINFKTVCVQHGMSVQKIALAQNRLRDNTGLYFCASKYEIENLNKPIYDYDGRNILRLTGVPRYDGLINNDQRQILISPTWRMQAALAPKGNEGQIRDYNPMFKETDYYKIYNSLINDPRLIEAAKKYNYKVIYVLHPIVSPQVQDFDTNDVVQIVPSTGEMSYEKVFCESSLMITDYSGVQFDFAYMRKPVLYLHHEAMAQHYEEGTFHYDTMGFGEICSNNDELIDILIEYMKNNCRMKDEYIKRADDFFEFDDHDNCRRIYKELIKYNEKLESEKQNENNKLSGVIRKQAIEGTLASKILQPCKKLPEKISKPIMNLAGKADGAVKRFERQHYAKKFQVQNNKIFMLTYDSNFICNQKYIAEELLRRKLDVDIVWGIPYTGKIDKTQFPKGIRLVRRGTEPMIRELASSKIWIENALDFGLYNVKKKKEQFYFNTWHGSMGIKKLSGDDAWLKRAAEVKKYTDFCITNSEFEEEVFRSTFWPETPFLKYGHARNDLFFHPEVMKEKADIVRNFYGIDKDTKIFLYAPTFREEGMKGYEQVNFRKLKTALTEKFGGEWVILVRWHHKERAKNRNMLKGQDVIDASDFGDMQELLPAVDIGMSDYSSWVYDYILAGKPVFLYIPDIEAYDQARGFYYPIESTPFPLSKNNRELIESVKSFNEDLYKKNVDLFLAARGCYERGNAAVRIADILEKIISDK